MKRLAVHNYTRALLQYGVRLPGEQVVRLQPSMQHALVRAETTPGAVPLVYNLELGEWETFTHQLTAAEIYGRTT